MKKQASRVCLGILYAILWVPRPSDFPFKIGQWLRGASHLLASEIPKGEQSYCLKKNENSKGMDFQDVFLAIPFWGQRRKKCEFCLEVPVSRFTHKMSPSSIQEFSRQTGLVEDKSLRHWFTDWEAIWSEICGWISQLAGWNLW